MTYLLRLGEHFQYIINIYKKTSCVPLLTDLLFYSYEAEFIQERITNKLITEAKRGISYDFDQKSYMFWKLVNSFKMMKQS
jgi:hypothetical protein